MIDLKYLYILLGQAAPMDAVREAAEAHPTPACGAGEIDTFSEQGIRSRGEPVLFGAIPVVCGPISVTYNGTYVFLPLAKPHTAGSA